MQQEPILPEAGFDVCIWSESVYYLGAILSIVEIYGFLERIVSRDGAFLHFLWRRGSERSRFGYDLPFEFALPVFFIKNYLSN